MRLHCIVIVVYICASLKTTTKTNIMANKPNTIVLMTDHNLGETFPVEVYFETAKPREENPLLAWVEYEEFYQWLQTQSGLQAGESYYLENNRPIFTSETHYLQPIEEITFDAIVGASESERIGFAPKNVPNGFYLEKCTCHPGNPALPIEVKDGEAYQYRT